MNSIRKNAYAKINLGLDVLRKRPDGYHEVSMIMQTIDLFDTLTIEKTRFNRINVKTNLSYLPCDHRNLVYRAAVLFHEMLAPNNGLRITLKKRIPVAAGLAGGSTDAAATLIALNELYHAGLTKTQLMELGVKLGADVPYCIRMGTALAEGIGEVLTPLEPMPECHILLVKPDISVSTKQVYENLKLDTDIAHPDITAMKRAIADRNLIQLCSKMDNILQTVTICQYPVIQAIKEKMLTLGALTSLMSGSGPTVFGIFDDYSQAEKAYKNFKSTEEKYQVFLTRPYWPESESVPLN